MDRNLNKFINYLFLMNWEIKQRLFSFGRMLSSLQGGWRRSKEADGMQYRWGRGGVRCCGCRHSLHEPLSSRLRLWEPCELFLSSTRQKSFLPNYILTQNCLQNVPKTLVSPNWRFNLSMGNFIARHFDRGKFRWVTFSWHDIFAISPQI